MGLEMGLEQARPHRKLKLLGLHGFRTSGDILRRQLSKWGPSLHELFDVDCIDAPLPCEGKSDVEGVFDGPYYEWFRFNKDFTEYYHIDEMFSYITDYMKLHGPYDGLLGFSQGAIISGCLAGLQEKVQDQISQVFVCGASAYILIDKLKPVWEGLALQDVPPIRLVVLISPAQLRSPHLKQVYEGATIKCPTLAFLGEKDWLRHAGTDALKSFENDVTINHRFGHTVPRLDEAETATAVQFFRSELAVIDAKDAAAPKDEVEASCLTSGAIEEVGTHILTNSHSEDVYVAA